MQLKVSAIATVTLGLLFLGACSSGNQTSNQVTNSTSSPAASTATNSNSAPANGHGGQGGQVIESDPYHLELVTAKEATGTHIDFFVQKGDNHEPVTNAKVTAQIQLPDGSQKSLDMKYDAQGQHYAAICLKPPLGNIRSPSCLTSAVRR